MTGCGVRNIEHFLGIQAVGARKDVSSPENAATADEMQYCMQAFEGVRTEKGASNLRTISKSTMLKAGKEQLGPVIATTHNTCPWRL